MFDNRIPKRFKLMGQTITIVIDGDRFIGRDGIYGFASYRTNEIELRPYDAVHPLNDEQMYANFWHEVAHFVIYYSGYAYKGDKDFMHQEEGFIEILSGLLHQVIVTSEYE